MGNPFIGAAEAIYTLLEKVKFRKKYWILAVEDDPEDREEISNYLRECNCNFNVAKSAEEALGMMARRDYSIIFIDHRLPLIPGFRLRDIILDESPKTTPIMVLGSAADMNLAKEGILIHVILKPVTHKAIEYSIKKFKL